MDAAQIAYYETLLACPAWSVALFAGLAAVYGSLLLVQFFTRPPPPPPAAATTAKDGTRVGSEAEFAAFQRRWAVVYTTIMLADWLQGTHMYALYSSYDLSKDDIGNLFLAGFGSGALFSTVIGPFVDRFGRKAGCVFYCVLEVRRRRRRAHRHALSAARAGRPRAPAPRARAQLVINCLEHAHTFRLLLLGRVLGGISTSLLFSAFESWLVSEHRRRGFPEQWLERTFSANGALNGVTAIAAGLLAQLLTANLRMGSIGPFRGAIGLTALALLQILSWDENYGDRQAQVGASLRLALVRMSSQRSLWLLGLVQSLFEGAMYTFVFNWVRRQPARPLAAARPRADAPSARPPRPCAGAGARAAGAAKQPRALPARPRLRLLHAVHRLGLRALRARCAQARRAADRRAHPRRRHGRACRARARRLVWRGARRLLRLRGVLRRVRARLRDAALEVGAGLPGRASPAPACRAVLRPVLIRPSRLCVRAG